MRRRILLLVLTALLILTACGARQNQNSPPAPPQAGQNAAKPEDREPPEQPPLQEDAPTSLGALTVELVADWQAADQLLGRLEELGRLLGEALASQGYETDSVTLTVSTAGGFTAGALASGGVDIAFLPALDLMRQEGDSRAVLLSEDDPIPLWAVAVTAGRPALDDDFQAALTQALTATQPGADFLDAYQPGITYLPAADEALQALRELAEEDIGEEGSLSPTRS